MFPILRRIIKSAHPVILVFVVFLIFPAIKSYAQCSGTDSFTVSASRCVGENITFTNHSNSADSFIWVWGDATSNVKATSTSSQTHKYTNDGEYTIKLLRYSNSGCKQTYSLKISVYDKPTANFTFTNNNSCSGTSIDFTNTSSGSGLLYEWDFGDKGTSTSTSPKHTFDAFGKGTDSFKVTLTAKKGSCEHAVSKWVKVKERPKPELFEVNSFKKCHSKVTGTDTFQLDITNLSDTNNITGYEIDWGDGSTKSTFGKSFYNTLFTYKKLGTFTLKITATGKNGCKGTTSYKVVNEANPVAGIIGPPSGTNEGCRPLKVRFINNSSDVSPSTVFTWDFGDGSTKVTWDASKYKDTIYHTFDTGSCAALNGQFTVTLIAKNECRSSTTTWNPIIVTEKPKPVFSFTNYQCAPKSIAFTNNSVEDCNYANKFSWNFGDPGSTGNTSSLKNPSHTYSKPGTYTVSLAVWNDNCSADTLKKTITLVDTPQAINSFVLTGTPSGSACGPATAAFTDKSTGGNLSYDWTITPNTNVTFKSPTKSSSKDPIIEFKDAGTYKITEKVSNACGFDTVSKFITIGNKPGISLKDITDSCGEVIFSPEVTYKDNGETITSYSWSFTGGSPSSSTDKNPKNIKYTIPGTYTYSITAKNACGSTTVSKSFKVYAEPNAKAGNDKSICSGDSAQLGSSAVSGEKYSWNPTTGMKKSDVAKPKVGLTNTKTVNDTFTYILTVTNANGCVDKDTVKVIVFPTLTINAGKNDTVCASKAAFNFSGATPTGGYFKGTGVTDTAKGTFNPKTAGAGTFTITYYYKDATTSCFSSATKKVIVNALPTVKAGNNDTFCKVNTSITLTGFSPSGGTWKGKGVTSAGVFNPNTADTGVHILYYIYTNSNGCKDSSSKKIKVITSTTADAGTNDTICVNAADFNLSGFSPSGGLWSGTGVSSTGKFSASTAGAGTFTLTYSYGTGSCKTTDTKVVKVNALPTVSAGSAESVCISKSAFDLTGMSPTGGYWKGTGITDSAKGTFNPKTATAGNYTLTYFYTDKTTGCSNSATKKITVNSLPTVSAGANDTFCKTNTNITLTRFSPSSGGTWKGKGVTSAGVFNPNTADTGVHILTYIYTDSNGCKDSATKQIKVITSTAAEAGKNDTACVDAADFNLSGFSPSGGLWSGTGVSSTGKFSASTAGAGTFTLTYSYGTGSCKTTDTKVVKVNALPTVSAGSNQSVCISASAFDLTGMSPSGGYWKGTGITDSAKGTFNPGTAKKGTHSVTYYYKDGTTSCINSKSKSITVNSLPTVSAGTNDTFCKANTNITLGGFSPTSGGTWKGKGVTSSGVFNPNTADTGVHILTYIYTDGNGCKDSATKKVKVVIGANADAGNNDTVCVDAADFALKGFSPSGGTWSGTGVSSSGTFSPSTAGSGTFKLTYTYGTSTCKTADTKVVKVNALPTVDAGSDESVCVSKSAFDLSGQSPTGGWWKGTGITDSAKGTFNPGTAGKGIFTLTYIYQDGTTKCFKSDTKKITVNALPTVSAGKNDTFCKSNVNITLSGFSPTSGGKWKGKGVSSAGVFNPNTADTGLHKLTYSYTDGNGCTDSATKFIKVLPPAEIDAGKNDTICIDNGILTLANFSPNGGIWSGTGVSSDGKFNPSKSDTGTFTLTYSYGGGTCLVKATKALRVNPLPIVSAGTDKDICITEPEFALSATPTGGTWKGTGIIDTTKGLFGAAKSGDGTFSIVYTYKNPKTLCVNSDTMKVTVRPLPEAGFTVNSLNCVGANISFTNTSSKATNYSWDFGDGKTSTDENPIHKYDTAGTFTVILISQILPGCTDTFSKTIKIIEPPKAQFTQSPDSGCAPLTVTFANFSADEITSYYWDFGNGQVSTDKDPSTVTYQQNDYTDTTYIISLTVKNICGTNTYKDSVKVFPKPRAIAGTDKNSGCSPAKIQFSNISIGKPDFYYWDFGNGKTSTLENPPAQNFVTDSLDSTYTIIFVAGNQCGTDTVRTQILVHPKNVTSFFNTSKQNGCVPFDVKFTDFSKGSTYVSWDFGDGNLSADKNPTHTFTREGTYKVRQFANNGCSFDTSEFSITVYPQPDIKFSHNPRPQCANEPVSFTNLSTGVSNAVWDFGDGKISALTSPNHTYTRPGKYLVRLTAESISYGCVSSFTDSVEISHLPKPDFTFTPNDGCSPLTVSFTNTSKDAKFYAWSFGDGNHSISTNPKHTYADTGKFTITLTAIDDKGCKDSIMKQIYIFPSPKAGFSMDINSFCDGPTRVNFTNNSKGAKAYSWDFGNGDVSNLTNPTGIFTSVGKYNVKLVVTNAFGCKDSTTQEFNIYPTPKAEFAYSPDSGCLPLAVSFVDQSIFADTLIWDFGDGNTSSEKNPVHVYTQAGTYSVKLKAIGKGGCENEILKTNIIKVHPKPEAGFAYIIQSEPKVIGTVSFFNQTKHAKKYYWDFGDGHTSQDSSPIHRYDIFGDYIITQIVETENGCRDTFVQQIHLDFFKGLFVPNAFTPDAGIAEVRSFKPKGAGLETYLIQIYTPDGELLWESSALINGQPAEGWDGKYKGKTLPQGVYVWKAQATFLDGSVWEGKVYDNGSVKRVGSITLIR
ncbi:MAG: PKD domain-containing protein [Bacteroidia bacterium]